MITALFYIVVVLILVALINWAARALATPEPVQRVILVASVVLVVLVIVLVFAQLLGISTGTGINLQR